MKKQSRLLAFFFKLETNGNRLTRKQFYALKNRAVDGDVDGARAELNRILEGGGKDENHQ